MALTGTIVSGCAHTPTTTSRVCWGTASICCWSRPGAPTQSNTTALAGAWPDESNGDGGGGAPVSSSHVSYGDVSAGATPTSAPVNPANPRPAGEKSLATIGPRPFCFKPARTASPTGPHP